jgi:hypothetical protein
VTTHPHEATDMSWPVPDRSLRAIRAALTVPQDREAFDAGLKAVLDEVRVSLDLAVLNDFVHRWWIMAADSATDAAGRRLMYARAEEAAAAGAVPPGRSWRDALSARGVTF